MHRTYKLWRAISFRCISINVYDVIINVMYAIAVNANTTPQKLACHSIERCMVLCLPWTIYLISLPLVEFWDGWKIHVCSPRVKSCMRHWQLVSSTIAYTYQSYDNIVGHRHSIVTKIQIPDSMGNSLIGLRETVDRGSESSIISVMEMVANNFHL